MNLYMILNALSSAGLWCRTMEDGGRMAALVALAVQRRYLGMVVEARRSWLHWPLIHLHWNWGIG